MNAIRLFVVYVFLFLCFSPGESFAQKRIAVIGSSSASGYFPPASGYPRDSAWAYKVKKHFKSLGIIDTLFNIAQSSTDCFEGMPSSYVPPPAPPGNTYRLPNPALNITRAVNLLPKPDAIIVNYPSNSYDWIPLPMVMTCLQTIKDSANAQNIRCFITTTQPRNGFSPSERIKLRVLRDSIMTRFGEWAIDFYTDIQRGDTIRDEYAIGDGIHLNPAGHSILKGKVLEKNLFFSVVPVVFGELKASSKESGVLLQWKTFRESSNRQFLVQHSKDGMDFSTIPTVEGTLNSSGTIPYSATDNHPYQGENYYRVIAESVQQQKEFSNIVSVNFNKSTHNIANVTAINGIVKISFSEKLEKPATAMILDASGKLISKTSIAAGSMPALNISIQHLSAGKYFLQIVFIDHKESFPLMKL
jgi:hypothetical protein